MTRRSASAQLMPLDEARALLLAGLAPVPPEAVPVHDAVGAPLARDLPAPEGRPARRLALRDGYAVEAAAITGAAPQAPVRLPRGLAWIEAGEILPEGSDTVLPPESVLEGEAVADAAPGEGARPAGGDIPAGHLLGRAGERATALQALALASAGFAEVPVRRPAVLLLVTGAETPDLLSPLLASLLAREGARVVRAARLPDDPGAVAAALTGSAAAALPEGAAATFLVGGSGPGRSDRSAEGLARAGTVAAHGIALRPGETAGFGAVAGRPVLLLPGRPEAALALHLALGRPLLAALAGTVPPAPAPAPLRRKIASAIGLSEVVFVRRSAEGAEPLGGADIPLARLARADGAVLVPPAREGYAKDTVVEVLPL
ncbi:molybdopterin-binding protein [Methylobacterium sp. WSM2598]|uniref:molybdopterin-binding protein n=1 Tax=Methylobacterium sp. WSM2598 TaxID=398261 RepID=UPI00037566B5|nr:molybdopterin-binding protein [Methylobacterium sp. WSM2598]